jgi:hypothetical protein
MGITKIIQENPPIKLSIISLQDFSIRLDDYWSKSISDIDQQLYKKYKLSKKEIAFIEENVQAMV